MFTKNNNKTFKNIHKEGIEMILILQNKNLNENLGISFVIIS